MGPDEFGLIAELFRPLAASTPGALGLADDAALFDVPSGKRLVLSADAIVAGVHFLPDDPPALIARKLVRVNVSDLAAMGAEPAGMLLVASFPHDLRMEWAREFAAGLSEDSARFGIALLGGDTVATPGPATFALTALGLVRKGRELLRSAARPGDDIWVSGTIGDGALGLFVAKGEALGLAREHAEYLLDRYRLPRPRVELGRALARGLAIAAMDISDGLAADLGHICEASQVGAVIAAARVPLSPAAEAALAAGLGEGMDTILGGGDDYELLFTADPAMERRILALSKRLGLRLTRIGRIIAGQGVRIEAADGAALPLPARGYRHFHG